MPVTETLSLLLVLEILLIVFPEITWGVAVPVVVTEIPIPEAPPDEKLFPDGVDRFLMILF